MAELENDFENGNPDPNETDIRSINDIIPGEENLEDLIDPSNDSFDNGNNNQEGYLPRVLLHDIMGNTDIEIPENLSYQEQTEIVRQSFEDVVNHYETQIQQVQQMLPNEYELSLLEAMRNGINPFEQMAPSIDINNKELVVREKLRMDNPGWEDSDIDAELNDILSSNKLDRYYKSAVPVVQQKAGGGNESWQQYQQQLEQQRLQEEQMEYQQDVEAIRNVAIQTNDFSGFELPNEMKNQAFAYATQINPQTGNTYLIDTLNNPEKIYRIAMLDLYFEKFVESLAGQQVNKVKEKLATKPIQTGGGSGQRESYETMTTEQLAEQMSRITKLGND